MNLDFGLWQQLWGSGALASYRILSEGSDFLLTEGGDYIRV
jgi:hypothetical protein